MYIHRPHFKAETIQQISNRSQPFGYFGEFRSDVHSDCYSPLSTKPLTSGDTTADADELPCDPSPFLRCEQEHSIRNIVRGAVPVGRTRHLVENWAESLEIHKLVGLVGINGAGSNRVDGNAVRFAKLF
jgi:hypothetical protein